MQRMLFSGRMALTLAAVAVIAAAASTAGAQERERGAREGRGERGMRAPVGAKAICVLSPTDGNKVSGTVTFTQQEEGVLIEATVNGLSPSAKHGFHIHEFGDISAADGTAAGGHFNPSMADHGAPDASPRHGGDFGNIETDADGVGHYSRVDKVVQLRGRDGVIGRGMIVHADTDDLTTQPTGNAGARVAQGVIGIAKAAE